jgi:DNA-binding NarL/FixJ family response regulator
MRKPSVLLADDHLIVAEGLRGLLTPHFDLVGIVGDGLELIESAESLRPDVIVADITMPSLNGIEAARRLTAAGSRSRVIILTMHREVTYAMRALEAGAVGFVLKHSATSELVTAIREAIAGRTYISPLIAGDLLRSYQDGGHPQSDRLVDLTRRQREVLQLVAEGHSSKEIATLLGISRRTAEFHKARVMEVLGVRTTAELTHYAIRHGLISS